MPPHGERGRGESDASGGGDPPDGSRTDEDGRESESESEADSESDAGTAPGRRLTRRTVLAGAGSLGVLGTVAGAGAGAMLSDDERARENAVTAGTLDLGIAWESSVGGTVRASEGTCDSDDPDDYVDSQRAGVTIAGVRPGEGGALAACALPRGTTPATVWVRLTTGPAAENGITGAERAAGDDSADEGELGDVLSVAVTTGPDCDAVRDGGGDPLASGSLASVVEGPLGEGVPLEASTPACLGLAWSLPAEPPATVETDAVSFGVEFAARSTHRDDDLTSNPWMP